jgi:peptidyl-dipeptidase Dcp
MNPLLHDFITAPFSSIENKHFKPAIQKAIEIARQEINTIVNNIDAPTFDNTTVALDLTGEKLDRITAIFFNLNAAETNNEIQKIAQEISPWLSEFKNDITLNEALFKRVKIVYNNIEKLALTAEQKNLVRQTVQKFC